MTKIDKSNIHGLGVFATEDISKGKMIIESPYIDVTGCTGQIQKYYFSVPKNPMKRILPLDRIGMINRSNNPNVKCEVVEDKIVCTSVKEIKSGQELVWNYSY